MPAPFSYKNDEDQDQRAAPKTAAEIAQQDQDDATFRDLTDAEHMAKDGVSGDKGDDIRDVENGGTWRSTYGGNQTKKGKVLSGNNVRAVLKKRGPLGLIAAIGLGGGIFGTLLFSPGLLIVQMKETFVDKFNTQLTSMDARTNVILSKKVSGLTSGVCGARVSVGCKYSTMSAKQVERFKPNITVEGDSVVGGRIRPTNFVLSDGRSIPANKFMDEYRTNASFRADVHKAYSPKFAGFADRVWARYASKIGVTKKPSAYGSTDEERAKTLKERVTNGDSNTTLKKVTAGVDTDPETGQPYTEDAANKYNTDLEAKANEFSSRAAKSGTTTATEVSEAIAEGADKGIAGVGNFFKVTGVADTACQAYGAVRTLGYAAKTIRAVQLARYAFAFFNIADQIKEGTAQPEDVAYFGGILTSIAYDAQNAARGAATDSFGYKFAAYGDVGVMDNFTMRFLAGGGLTGDLIMVTSEINKALGGNAKSTCATLANPWVQGGSIIAGIGLMLIPGVGQAAFGAKAIVQGAFQVAISVALIVLPDLLKEVVAGTVTDGLIGADSGNGWTSGSGGFLGGLAAEGGNAPMKKDDAVAYLAQQEVVAAHYSQDEAQGLSPLDPSNKYTFVGSMVNSLLPYIAPSYQSGSSILSSVGSIVSGSFSNIIPKTEAATTAQIEDSMEICQDDDYRELDLATDPFCNVVYGIPTQYLDRDPVAVSEELESRGLIDGVSGQPLGEYADFVSDCILRTEPLGSTGEDQQTPDGSDCVINDSNANFYLFYLDQRIEDGMDGYVEGGGINDSKQQIAQRIVDKGNVQYIENPVPTIESIADGSVDPDNEPCGINIYILKIIDAVTDEHSIKISSINRQCSSHVPNGSSTASRHYAGNGSAIDIAVADGVITDGRNAKSRELLDIILPILAQAAEVGGGVSAVGQSNCGDPIRLPVGVITFSDFCNHIHIEVVPTADPNLKYSPGKAI